MKNQNILWKPTKVQIINSQMYKFMQYINSEFKFKIESYDSLYNWSVENIDLFWDSFRKYSGIIFSENPNEVIDDIHKMPGAKWFNGGKLNFAENLLKYKNDKVAIRFFGEDKVFKEITFNELYREVSKVQKLFLSYDIKEGDKIAGYIPNLPEAIICMLATVSIGAIWSSCSPDFGVTGVLDRFEQIQPKVMIVADGYYYKGKSILYSGKVNQVIEGLTSLELVVEVPYIEMDNSYNCNSINYNSIDDCNNNKIEFNQLSFDHPLYIMYSSGTTGKPKSIVHSAGGTLIQHLKELKLHVDLRRGNNLFYFTTCGWMMWNWLVSGLAIGATVNLFDGNPFYPTFDYLLKIADKYNFNVFGTSAKYISSLENFDVVPKNVAEFNSLKSILSTGSPLMEENYEFIYNQWKSDVQLSSISGGTDIISCFALGNPILPVYKGELQGRGLGMAVKAFNDDGESIINQTGELVCTKPFPSMPIYFWNDTDNKKYLNAYFAEFGGIWTHGDFVEINEHGGVKILGRSDATLNPGGVRIGTAEIYRVVENLPEIEDSLIIGQNYKEDQRIVLFVKLNDNVEFSDKLINNILLNIRKNCSPRHVPGIVLEIAEIPYTINGKKVEIAVKKVIEGKQVSNKDALQNPNSLDQFKSIPELTI